MSNWTSEQFKEYAQRRLKQEERARLEMQQNHETHNPLARLQDPVREPQAREALVPKPRRAKGRNRRVAVRVTIVSFRHRLLDSDNLVAGAKPLRDLIAASLHCSDAERSGIEWEYEQCLTRGTEGTVVRVERLCQ